MCLGPTTHQGRALLARLPASADVVIDNMRAGALGRMGFDDARLRELNPPDRRDGDDGGRRDEARAGQARVRLAHRRARRGHRHHGAAGRWATEIPMSLPDPCAGLHAAIGTVATRYRQRTMGIGADIECSMLEAWISALPWSVLSTSAEGRPRRSPGPATS